MKRLLSITTGLWIIFSVSVFTGCKSTGESTREYEKLEKQMMKGEQKSLREARDHHVKIQSKATRQMMKDAKKRAKQLNKPKKR